MQWYLSAFKKYADFSGRARRQEYWKFALFNALALLTLWVIAVAGAVTIAVTADPTPLQLLPAIPFAAYWLACIVPSIAVMVRRLHDTGRSGAWYFMVLIPFGIGGIILLVFALEDSQYHPNQYGECPKPPPAYYPWPQQPQPVAPMAQ